MKTLRSRPCNPLLAVLSLMILAYAIWAHSSVGLLDRRLLLKDDSLHTLRAQVTGLHSELATMKTDKWLNGYTLERIQRDVDTLKVEVFYKKAKS